jgi:hypothetical protein
MSGAASQCCDSVEGLRYERGLILDYEHVIANVRTMLLWVEVVSVITVGTDGLKSTNNVRRMAAPLAGRILSSCEAWLTTHA